MLNYTSLFMNSLHTFKFDYFFSHVYNYLHYLFSQLQIIQNRIDDLEELLEVTQFELDALRDQKSLLLLC